jgi:hypothetical protein
MDTGGVWGWLRGIIRREVIDDVPPGMDLCLDCGELHCSDERFAACAPRKARAAQIAAASAEGRHKQPA